MAVAPAVGAPLYCRAFKLWRALDSYMNYDGVPEALRAEAECITARRCGFAEFGPGCPHDAGVFPADWESHLDAALERQEQARAAEMEPQSKLQDALVVYSYHQESAGELGEWWQQAKRSAASLREVHRHHVQVPIHIVSNVRTEVDDEGHVFDEHVYIDLAGEAGLPGKGRALCGTKIKAMIACLERGFQKVIFMDSDTHIMRPFLSPMLAALDYYDVTGAFEGYPLGMAQTGLDPILENPLNMEMSFELNTGVLGVRASALELCKAWLHEFRTHVHKYAHVSSADQPALMQVLRHRRERVFPLPPAFNFRPYTVYSTVGPSMPAVVHDHHPDGDQAHRDIVEAVCSHMRAGLRV